MYHKKSPEEVVSYEFQPIIVHARPVVLEMIFGNLLDNAVKYAGDPPEVQVVTSMTGRGRVRVQIIDNGEGIPADQRRQIFGMFYRGGKELERRQKAPDWGYISRTLRHIPGRDRSPFMSDRTGRAVFEVEPGSAGGMKILIVEDEEALAKGLKFNFEQEGFEVEMAGDGQSALSLFDTADPPFDLLILDHAAWHERLRNPPRDSETRSVCRRARLECPHAERRPDDGLRLRADHSTCQNRSRCRNWIRPRSQPARTPPGSCPAEAAADVDANHRRFPSATTCRLTSTGSK